MTIKVEFHFDFGSPNAYLAHRVIPSIESRTAVKFEYKPVLIGGVFKATNNVSPMVSLQGIKNKPEYNAIETARYLVKHKIENYKSNPFFPINTLQIMRGAIYAQQAGFGVEYIAAAFRAMWEDQVNMAEADEIIRILTAADLPAAEILNAVSDPQIKQKLIDNTNESVTRGAFGSPTFFVGDEIYFGKDKLVEVEEAISSLA